MSTAEAAATEGLTPPTSATPDALADPVPRAGTAPLEASALFVPSTRTGAFGSDAPSSTSGSISSAEANSVGISPESGPAAGTGALEGGEVETDEAGGASGPKSSSTPCASKSSSESVRSFGGTVGGWDAVVDAGVAADEEGRAPPVCDAVPFNPNGSSTGRSAKGSKAGREAASIIFEPESGDQSGEYPAVPLPRYLGAGSQIGGTALCS